MKVEGSKGHVIPAGGTSRTPRGVLSVCAWCNRVRNDKGVWRRVKGHGGEDPDIRVTHGICPACAAKVRAARKKHQTQTSATSWFSVDICRKKR